MRTHSRTIDECLNDYDSFNSNTDTYPVLQNQKVILQAEKTIIEMLNAPKINNISDKFLNAVRENNYTKTKALLEAGADINHSNGNETALKIAIDQSNAKMVHLLLKRKISLTNQNSNLWMLAIQYCLNFNEKNTINPCQKPIRVFYLILRDHFKQDILVEEIKKFLVNKRPYYPKMSKKLIEAFCYECILQNKPKLFKNAAVEGRILPLSSRRLINYLHIIKQYTSVSITNLTFETLNILVKDDFVTEEKFNIYSKILNNPKSYYYNPKKHPTWLSTYLHNAKKFESISLKHIIANLQYDLGLLDEPGTNKILSQFKEGKKYNGLRREKNYSLDQLRKFLHPDNQNTAISCMCMNQGVKDGILQLAAHPKLAFLDKRRCLNLLNEYDKVCSLEKNTIELSKYTLAQIEKIILSQQQQLNLLTLQISQLHQQAHSSLATKQAENNEAIQTKHYSQVKFFNTKDNVIDNPADKMLLLPKRKSSFF